MASDSVSLKVSHDGCGEEEEQTDNRQKQPIWPTAILQRERERERERERKRICCPHSRMLGECVKPCLTGHIHFLRWVRSKINFLVGPQEPLLATIERRHDRHFGRVGNAVVGRENAGWTTSKSGHPCPCQNSYKVLMQKRLEEVLC